MPNPGDRKCIDGAEYVWTPAAANININTQLADIIDLLTVISGKIGAAAPSTDIPTYGGYRAVEQDVDPRRNDWEISWGLDVRNLNIRVDQAVKIKLGTSGGDQIKVDPTESPFEILNLTTPVSVIYVTTSRDSNIPTNVRILAY